MRLFVLLILFLFSCFVYSQEWVEAKLSDDVTVSMPDGYIEKGDDERNFFHKMLSDWQLLFAHVMPLDTNQGYKTGSWVIKDTFQLKEKYQELTNYFNSEFSTKVITDRFARIGDLICYESKSKSINSENHDYFFFELIVNQKRYEFVYSLVSPLDSPEVDNKEIRDRFFSSIKLREGLTFEDQITK